MINDLMNINSPTYYGTATTSSGSTAVDSAKLPLFDQYENIVFTNYSTDVIAVKTGSSAVTVAFPTSNDTAAEMTIVPANVSLSIKKEKGHTTFAVDSLAGPALYSVQYGNGK